MLILGIILVAFTYFAVNHIMAYFGHTVWDPEFPWDRAIPVIPWMIVPYSTLFILNPLPIFIHPRHERGRMELLLTLQAIATLTLVSCLFFILLPAEIDMRNQIPADILAGGGGIFGGMFRNIHFSDAPWNSWPSLHISQSLVLMMVVSRWFNRDWSEKSWSKPLLYLLWVNWALLVISTVTTKQHYLWDVATGMLLGVIWWWMLNAGLSRLDILTDQEITDVFVIDEGHAPTVIGD